MNEYFLLLGADSYLRERALAGARQASRLPIWNVVADPLRVNNRFFDGCIHADPQDKEGILDAIRRTMAQRQLAPRAIVPVNDWSLRQATFLNRELGLTGLSDEVTAQTRDKFLMKQKLRERGVPTAAGRVIGGPAELDDALREIALPVVIKPIDFGGSGGVSLARTAAQAHEALKFAMDMMDEYAATYQVDATRFLVEEFIDTEEEVSVEVLCHGEQFQAIAVTEKYLSPLPYFAEIGHLVPSHRSGDARLKEIACQACRALGINLGVAHVEIKIRGGQYWVIELAARPGGDAIMDLVENAYGENMYKRHVLSYLGCDPLFESLPVARKTAAISFLKAREGEIAQIRQDVDIPAALTNLEIIVKPGHVSEASKCWRSREGIA
jgi:biotin carboxylase